MAFADGKKRGFIIFGLVFLPDGPDGPENEVDGCLKDRGVSINLVNHIQYLFVTLAHLAKVGLDVMAFGNARRDLGRNTTSPSPSKGLD